jgi:hypothetical protein
MLFPQSFRNFEEWDGGPKHSEMIACKFWVSQTISMTVSGKENFSFVSFSISVAFIISTKAKDWSRSISVEFKEDISGQKKMLTPEGRSGVSHRKSQFHRQVMKVDDG